MDHHISTRRPDKVYIYNNAKVASVNDIAVPADRHVKDKEIGKIDKCQDLCLEIQQLWNMRMVVVLVAVDALGVVSTHVKYVQCQKT